MSKRLVCVFAAVLVVAALADAAEQERANGALVRAPPQPLQRNGYLTPRLSELRAKLARGRALVAETPAATATTPGMSTLPGLTMMGQNQPDADPLGSLQARLNTIKAGSAQKITDMSRDQQLTDLQTKLDHLNDEKRRASEQAQDKQVASLEDEIAKIEETQLALKKNNEETNALLKAVLSGAGAQSPPPQTPVLPAIAPPVALPQYRSQPAAFNPPTSFDRYYSQVANELGLNPNTVQVPRPTVVQGRNPYATIADLSKPSNQQPFGGSSVPAGLVRPRIVDRGYVQTGFALSGLDNDHLNNQALNPALHSQRWSPVDTKSPSILDQLAAVPQPDAASAVDPLDMYSVLPELRDG